MSFPSTLKWLLLLLSISCCAQDTSILTLEKILPLKKELVVAIDAGHGGIDPGAIGKSGTQEKHITLAIAKKVATQLAASPDIRPILIRDTDHYLILRERIEKARKNKADLFVSIHADAGQRIEAKGASVFVLSENGASNENARWLAEQENRADLLGGVSLDDKDDVLAFVLLNLAQSANERRSLQAANYILQDLKKITKLHSATVQNAEFVVLKSPDIPSVLIETEFISNPKSEKKLLTKEYQDNIAAAIVRGIENYLEHVTEDVL